MTSLSNTNSMRIDVPALLESYAPSFWKGLPVSLRPLTVRILRKILCAARIEEFYQEHCGVRGFNLIDDILDVLDKTYLVTARELEHIPAAGRAICVSNHPLGGLDALMILRVIGEIRSDIRIVVNDALLALDGFADLFLPVDVFAGKKNRASIEAINEALEKNQAVIFFPAAEVSRLSLRGIADTRWRTGAVRIAQRHHAPLLPIRIDARNTMLFYAMSLVMKSFSTLLLPREVFQSRRAPVRLRIGELVPYEAFAHLQPKAATKLIRKQSEALTFGKKGPFKTERGIARPTERYVLRCELDQAIDIGSPVAGKRLFLADADHSPSIVREIARLREMTFRSVGEGTGKRLDRDRYDHAYRHLTLWDEEQMEIVGSYRLGFCDEILPVLGVQGLYTASLFQFSEEFIATLPHSIELGRSFVQRQYWNSFALEYLWAGLGAVMANEPNAQYLFGPVSISRMYSADVKEAMVFVCSKWYGAPEGYVRSFNSYKISDSRTEQLKEYFSGTTYREDLNKLKLRLRALGVSIPTLIRQYSELCSPEGVRFCDFGVDESFGSCIDGFIQLELAHLTDEKRQRYIEQYRSVLTYPGRGLAAPAAVETHGSVPAQ